MKHARLNKSRVQRNPEPEFIGGYAPTDYETAKELLLDSVEDPDSISDTDVWEHASFLDRIDFDDFTGNLKSYMGKDMANSLYLSDGDRVHRIDDYEGMLKLLLKEFGVGRSGLPDTLTLEITSTYPQRVKINNTLYTSEQVTDTVLGMLEEELREHLGDYRRIISTHDLLGIIDSESDWSDPVFLSENFVDMEGNLSYYAYKNLGVDGDLEDTVSILAKAVNSGKASPEAAKHILMHPDLWVFLIND